jgi:MerR family transcriptional regulator, copper efflux regulator
MKSTTRPVPTWSIGELAARYGLATHVLRHWEDQGLLTPERDSAGRRWYVGDDVVRVAVIMRSKAAGMSLHQILLLLDASAEGRREVLEAHLADLDHRMAEMARSRDMTVHALDCRAHDIATCPNFRAHVADVLDGTTRTLDRLLAPGGGQRD